MITELEKDKNEWVSKLRGGDERAFEQLFRTFYPTLCFFAKRLVPEPGMAGEIVQDCLFKAWQKRTDFDSYLSLKGFLYISTKNACMDSIDKENRKNKRDHSYYLEQPNYERTIEEEIIYAEVLLKISQAIELLPDQCSKIMKMLYEDGKKAKEIAEALNLSISTVNNQKARGISLLKNNLGTEAFLMLTFMLSSDIFN